MRVFLVLTSILVAICLSGCGMGTKTAWAHYDECATQNLPFADMVACGKQRRTAYCENSCSAEGNAVVMYAVRPSRQALRAGRGFRDRITKC
jgi:hypothetical protein